MTALPEYTIVYPGKSLPCLISPAIWIYARGMLKGMSREFLGGQFRHGLTFIATLDFVISFFDSRLFATLFPTTVVMQGGIHLHHFWYGIALIRFGRWLAHAW